MASEENIREESDIVRILFELEEYALCDKICSLPVVDTFMSICQIKFRYIGTAQVTVTLWTHGIQVIVV